MSNEAQTIASLVYALKLHLHTAVISLVLSLALTAVALGMMLAGKTRGSVRSCFITALFAFFFAVVMYLFALSVWFPLGELITLPPGLPGFHG